jgi:hypothetical protein
MQNSSQQPPENQRRYPPSEIYVYDEPLTFSPVQEITRPPLPLQEIAIPINRGQASWRAAVCVLGLVILLVLLIPLLSLITSAVNMLDENPLELIILALVVFTLVFWLMALIFVGWINWGMFSGLISSRQPLLVINREGITVRRMPILSAFFIAWNEFGAIYTRRALYKYLCIVPKYPDLYLKRFNAFERFLRRSNALVGIPSLIIPQVYLARPVEEILQQLYHIYSSELSSYHIQLRF